MPLSTGEAAKSLGVLEPQLNDLVRRGKIDPAPPLVAGRRLWGDEHLRAAAERLEKARANHVLEEKGGE